MNSLFPYFKVEIEESACRKIMDITMASKGECSGFGMVKKQGNSFLIYDVVIPKQSNSASHTEIDVDAMCEMMSDMAMEGKDTADWKCWWHSHADFNVFYSGTDNATIESFMEFVSPENAYLISIVVNHAGDMVCRLDIAHPLRMTMEGVKCDIKKNPILLLPPPPEPVVDKDKIISMIRDSKGVFYINGKEVVKVPLKDTLDVIMKRER